MSEQITYIFTYFQMSEQYTAANDEYAEAKTTLTKCEHDLKSQDTVLGEIKAAVEAAKKQNSDIQTNLDTCTADLEKKKAEQEKKKVDEEKAAKEKAEQDKAEQEKKEKEAVSKFLEDAKEEKKEDKKEEKKEEKKEDAPEEKKEEKAEEKKEEKDKKEENVTKEAPKQS